MIKKKKMDRNMHISNKIMRIMEKLNDVASNGEMSTKHAAGLIKGGKLIDFSVNSHRSKYKLNGTHFIQCSLHAEVAVLRKLIYNLEKNKKLKNRKMNKYTLMVIRENYSNSLPCKHCSNLIKKTGITKIYYSNGNMDHCILTRSKVKNLKNEHQSRAVLISSNYLVN